MNLVGDASARPLLETLAAHPGRWDTASLLLLGSGGSILSGDAKDALMSALPTVLAIVGTVFLSLADRDKPAGGRATSAMPESDAKSEPWHLSRRVTAVVAVAPCQCFSPGSNRITSPG